MNTDIDFCKGVNCALKEHCKRYLSGLHYREDNNPHWWFDSCDEERSMYLDDSI